MSINNSIPLVPLLILLFSGQIMANTHFDFDGDGKGDILYRGDSDLEWRIDLMDGTTLKDSFEMPAMSSCCGWLFNGVGDFDGDGKSDVIIRNVNSGQWYIYNLDSSNVVSRGYVPIESAVYIGVQAVADFNNDGFDDVLLRNENTGEWTMTLLKNRAVLEEYKPPMSQVLTWKIVDARDFDGNGSADILIRNTSSGAWYIYLYDGTDIISRGYITEVLPSDLNEEPQGVGDFNGDGKNDVLMRNLHTNEWSVFLMDGRSPIQGKNLPLSHRGSWELNSVDDFDGDGTSDVSLRNRNTKVISLHIMDDTSIESEVSSLFVSLDGTDTAMSLVSRSLPMLETSITIPSPKEYFDYACEAPAIQAVLPVNLTNDEYTDLIIHYWCGAFSLGYGGEYKDTQTPDALVALISESEGEYRVANETVFGTSFIGLGGVSRKVVRRDINGDGLDDFAFAMNWEDGRLAEDGMSNAAEQALLISNENNGYDVVKVGDGLRNWAHAVAFVSNENGTTDALFAGYTTQLQAYRYDNGTFSDVRTEYPDEAGWASGFTDIYDGTITNYIAASSSQHNSDTGLEDRGMTLFGRSDGNWSDLFSTWFYAAFQIEYLSWNLSLGTVTVYNVDELQSVGVSFEEFCVMPPLTGNGSNILVSKIANTVFDEPLIAGNEYREDDGKGDNRFVFYEIGQDNLTSISSPMVNEQTSVDGAFFDCRDVNSDGFPDLVFFVNTLTEEGNRAGKPIVYVNDGLGKLVWRDMDDIPGYSKGGSQLMSKMFDANGDGIEDIFIHGISADNGNEDFEIKVLARPLR